MLLSHNFCFQSLMEAHDKVAAKSYETPPSAANNTNASSTSLMPADTVRMISIQKKAGEPLVRELIYMLSYNVVSIQIPLCYFYFYTSNLQRVNP